MIIGIASVVLSIICFNMDDGYYVSEKTYGGDAYTGIQNASAQTGQNIQKQTKINRFGFGAILMVGGLTLIALGFPENKKGESEETTKE